VQVIGSAEPRRNVEPEPLALVEKIITELTLEQAYRVTKAFAAYFELINLAEANHRKRRLRASRALSEKAQEGSFQGTLERLKRNGVGVDEAVEWLSKVMVIPTFTAHPTEVARRTVLTKRRNIAREIEQIDWLPLTNAEANEREGRVAAISWRSGRRMRCAAAPPPCAMRSGWALNYYTNGLIETLPRLYTTMSAAIHQVYGKEIAACDLPSVCDLVPGSAEIETVILLSRRR